MMRSQKRRASHIGTHYTSRKDTPLETAVDGEWDEAERFVDKMPKNEKEVLTFFPKLQDAIFCGHLMADLDSIAGAIGAAYLYGGTPARASEINSETKWALEKWKCDLPVPVEDLLEERSDRHVCLVDFQQQSQLNDKIPMSNIVGIIDHHALQSNTVITERPVFVDIRPWGSMSSILAHSFAVQEKHLPKNIAGILLSAILSDTLNLRSPTTTKWDERMVSMLVQYLGIPGKVNELAAKQFRAKSHELSLMTAYQLVNGDMKQFKFDSAATGEQYVIAYGVIETTDAAASLERIDEILPEIRETKEEKNLTAMLLAVVDIVQLSSSLFIAGPVEESLAVQAYGGKVVDNVLELPGLVSRKKDFIPPLTRAVNEGWTKPALQPRRRKRGSIVVMNYADFAPGRLERVFDEEGSGEENE